MSSRKHIASSLSALSLLGLAGCASTGTGTAQTADDEGLEAYQAAIDEALKPATTEQIQIAERADPLSRAKFWGEEFRKSPTSLDITVRYLQSLRAIGSHDRALEVASKTIPYHPRRHEILLEVGRSLMAQDKIDAAAQAFVRSSDFAPLDVADPLAALAVAFDKLGRHDEAQEIYWEALHRDPGRVSTRSNYGMSLALTGRLEEAEEQLRLAANAPEAGSTVRQNLALILGLQGKFEEMEAVDPTAPRRTVQANREALEAMMRPARSYEALEDPHSEEMPSVSDAGTTAEEMAELTSGVVNQNTDAPQTGLRPRLRGSQGG